jgi:tight adherence protein C
VVDAPNHRERIVTLIACSTVAAAIVLVAGRMAPHRRTRRVPMSNRTDTRRTPPNRRRRRTRLVVAITSMIALTTLAAGPTAGCTVAGLSGFELARRRHQRAASQRRAIATALPDAIEFLVLMVHAGLSPTQAVVEAAQRAPLATRAGFAATVHRLQRGQGLAEASRALHDELGPAARPVTDAIAAADRYGLPLAPLLDTLADQAHAARRRLGEAEARRLPVRLAFPLVVCTLPSFALLAIVPAVMGTISSLRGRPA